MLALDCHQAVKFCNLSWANVTTPWAITDKLSTCIWHWSQSSTPTVFVQNHIVIFRDKSLPRLPSPFMTQLSHPSYHEPSAFENKGLVTPLCWMDTHKKGFASLQCSAPFFYFSIFFSVKSHNGIKGWCFHSSPLPASFRTFPNYSSWGRLS